MNSRVARRTGNNAPTWGTATNELILEERRQKHEKKDEATDTAHRYQAI